MDLQLTNQLAVVVGGAQGIGRAIAAAFAREEAPVALIDVNPAVTSVAMEIEQQHEVPARPLIVDATQLADLEQAAAELHGQFGPPHHVVYAAGVGSGKYGFPFWNLAPSDWPRVLEVNLMGAVNTAHVFAPAMTAARRGSLLFLSSVAGQIGSQTDPPYSAAKAAVINFAQCAARDLSAYNVRVNTLCPGMVKTTLNRSVWKAWHDQQPDDQRLSYDDWAQEKIDRVAPLGRWQDPEDIAAMAVFLASSQAHNITGQTINVDGGQVMHW